MTIDLDFVEVALLTDSAVGRTTRVIPMHGGDVCKDETLDDLGDGETMTMMMTTEDPGFSEEGTSGFRVHGEGPGFRD